MNRNYRILLAYKNFSKDCNVSHIGLGVTAAYTAKTLMANGIIAQAFPAFGADDIGNYVESQESSPRPITHVIVMAQWIPTIFLAKLCRKFPHVKFTLNCHSNVGFLQAEPRAIDLLREAIDLETGQRISLPRRTTNAWPASWGAYMGDQCSICQTCITSMDTNLFIDLCIMVALFASALLGLLACTKTSRRQSPRPWK
jgi:hypothetical protein